MVSRRLIGPDILRNLCCLGVVVYHVFDDIIVFEAGSIYVGTLIYFLASFCVSGFFMLSGYLAGKKKEMSVLYPVRKIADTLIKYSFWLIVARAVRYLCGRPLLPLAEDFCESFMAGGSLPAAWFLFTYMIIMVLSYFLHLVLNRNLKIFAAATLFMLVFSAVPNPYNMMNRAQQFWIPLYTAFFMTGMLISRTEKHFSGTKAKLLMCAANVAAFAVYMFNVFSAAEFTFPHTHYNRYYYIVWLITLFILICGTDIHSEKLSCAISFMAKGSFTVYMFHLSVLRIVGLVFVYKGIIQASAVTVGAFILCQFISAVMRKIPLLKFVA